LTENLSSDKPTWTQVSSAPAVSRYRIATHPFNEKLVAIATDKAVWISRDKGVSWEELSGFPASGVINLFFDRNTAEGLYAANSMTVWYRDETLSNWIEFNKGLPLQNNSEMEIRYYADGDSRLWISKYGRGVWSSPLYSSMKKQALIADFTFHGNSIQKAVCSVGDTVQLNDLTSGTTTSREWKVTGAGQTLTAGNDSMPKFSFTVPGTYTVSLKVSGTSGSDSISKIGYIRITDKIKKIDSIPSTGTGGAWYLGISGVTVNGLKHGSNGNTNLFYEDLTGQTAFTNLSTDSATVAISPTQNDATWGVSYAKVYVDFNNNGSFDASELVYAPAGKSQGHVFKFLAPVSVIKNVPLRMRVIANRLSQISGAYASQIDQGQAEDHTIIFTTPKPVLTVNASVIGTDSISVSGTVTGAGTVVDQGFIYSAFKPTPQMTDAGRVSCGTKTFTAGIGSITANRTYYVRSYAIDESGTFLSEVDTVTPKTFTIPLLESSAPTYDPATKQWSGNGRINGSNGSVDSLFVEYGTDGKFTTTTQIKSISGVRNQWDSVSVALATLPRYSAVQYRLRAVVDGKPYISTTKTFNSEKDLYAYWTFDETGTTAFDYSGNNRNATLGSTLTRTSDNRGGSALQFDSIGDLATIGLANLAQPFTLMFRVNRTADNSIGNATILDGGSRRVELETWNKTRKLGVQYQNNYDRASTYSAPINEWHTIAMVCANDSIKLAVDGTYHSTFAAAGYTLPLNTFGRNGSSMNGLLDEVKVYSRALDSTSIADAMKMVQKVSFDPIPNAKVGDPAIALNATSSKGTAVRFELVSGTFAVTLAGSAVTILDSGTVTIRAIADGSAELLADTALQTFAIIPADIVGILSKKPGGTLPLLISPNPARVGIDAGIAFTVADPAMKTGSVILFDVVGNQVNRIEFTLNAGVWVANWNLLNSAGIAVGSGSYSAVIQMITTDGSKKSVRKTVGVGK